MTGLRPARFLGLLLMVGYCLAGAGYAASDAQQSGTAKETQTIHTDDITRILALSDDFAYGEYLAGECASCHSLHRVVGSNVPVIHGAEPEHLVRALLEFRAGIRSNASMQLVASGLGEEEIAAVVHYLATAKE